MVGRGRSRKAGILAMLVGFLAASVLPRAASYAHRHDAGPRGHVHGWDGSRVGELAHLIADLRASGGADEDVLGAPRAPTEVHRHEHGGPSDAGEHHRHDHAHHRTRGAHPGGRADHRVPEQGRGERASRPHAPEPAQPAPFAAAISTAIPFDATHSHGQAPFQLLACAMPPALDVRLAACPGATGSPPATTNAAPPLRQARAPPASVLS